ncbi:hypothetical protein Scep_024903 [Stephania cephalantha]|uniref:Uncharacterized protein n=1 Tax=Stephania cephalantha TaxID=152367 RepID=A0AAP0HU37_9MAGN
MESQITDHDETLETLITSPDETLTRVFAQLKPYCVDLLSLLQNPRNQKRKSNAKSLSEFLELLRRTQPGDLQPFFDYALFPLLLLFDAAVGCRSSESKDGVDVVSDGVAEGVVLCLEELLRKCCIFSVNQMVVVMKKLTYGAMLSPSDASEEFREAVIRCLRALLLSLNSCSVESCACGQNSSFAAMSIVDSSLQVSTVSSFKYKLEQRECLLAFLRSENASAAVGHWLSLLLKAADIEASRGQRGSAKLRVEALLTLRVLVSKVGTADSLAFFLPGVVSQFAKILNVSKSMISGAAGSTEALNQAIRGLSEFLIVVLGDQMNTSNLDFNQRKDISSHSFLDALRHLPINAQGALAKDCGNQPVVSKSDYVGKGSINCGQNTLSFHVNRTKEWIEETSANVDKLLSATLPHICVHPAKKVRRGLVGAIKGLLSNCSCTLKRSKLMLLECLCVLVTDDVEEVSISAQEFLESFFTLSDKQQAENEVADIFLRLVEKLPKVVLGSEETLAVSHAQKLLAVMYYAGPQLVVDHLLRSPITAAHFLDALMQCLNQNSVFSGSLEKIFSAKLISSGYLHSIAELKVGVNCSDEAIVSGASSEFPKVTGFHDIHFQSTLDVTHKEFEVPRMPPWFIHVGSEKLYLALAGILRLVGLSTMADPRDEVSLSTLIDIPLSHLHKLISEVRMRGYSKESWQSWYTRSGSGQLLRQACTAVCILNEIIYGLSDQSVKSFSCTFQKSRINMERLKGTDGSSSTCNSNIARTLLNETVWKVHPRKNARIHLIECIGSILHEYLSAEVIIDGIGTFNVCLGENFSLSGYLHSSLYLLLENLICSNGQIRMAADAVLRIISTSSGHPNVGCLVVANADYIVDSLCRQLRHLDLNPHVPRVLAAMLSYVGVANRILPLLEEPMRSVSMELEILGRHQHPNLTVPFLKASLNFSERVVGCYLEFGFPWPSLVVTSVKSLASRITQSHEFFLRAVGEIVKASRNEASAMPKQAESYCMVVDSKLSLMDKEATMESGKSLGSLDGGDSHVVVEQDLPLFLEDFIVPSFLVVQKLKSFSEEKPLLFNGEGIDSSCSFVDTSLENWEKMMFKLNEFRRYRRIVGSVAGSCLTAATPLLASLKEATCLVALDIIEDGIATLAKVEEAFKHEKETKRAIEKAIQLCSFHDLQDTLDADADETDENRLLPVMNKIWPYLVVCIRGKNPAAVRRCLDVVGKVIQICGGDFFSRRFCNDGPHFWKLLMTSPFQKKQILGDEKQPLQLPYRALPSAAEEPLAESSSLKVQAAALNMIADLSRNKRSASALQAVLKKVCGLVVGIACSGVTFLRDASVNALAGLGCIDSDLVWLLLADVYYSLNKNDLPSPPSQDFPQISQLLPASSSPKEYLHAHYGGGTFGFGIDPGSVEIVFKKLSNVLNDDQMYSENELF